jgi:hypothetical protein
VGAGAKGGWLNRKTGEAFVRYARLLFIAAKVPLWLTINEQNTMILHPGAIGVPADCELPDESAVPAESPDDAGPGADLRPVPPRVPRAAHRPGDKHHVDVRRKL